MTQAMRYPLSFAQQRLWFIAQLEPENPIYNSQRILKMDGRLKPDVLERCLKEIIGRHEILRTSFPVVGSEPVQCVASEFTPTINTVDLRETEGEDRAAQLSRLCHDEVTRPFDLTCLPLLRVSLVPLEEETHLLLLTMHHIIADGPSYALFIGELADHYESSLTGRPPACGELPLQYRDFARRQRENLQGGYLERLSAYWGSKQKFLAEGFEIPTDRPRRSDTAYQGSSETAWLGAACTESLKRLSRAQRVTLFMTVAAVFKILLSHRTARKRTAFVIHLNGRNRIELEPLIGLFTNQVILCSELQEDSTFRELLAQTKEEAFGAYAHQDLPFERLTEISRRQTGSARAAELPVHLVYQPAMPAAVQMPGVTVSILPSEYTPARFDLTLFARELTDDLKLTIVYNTELFFPATIRRLLRQFELICTMVVRNPEIPLRDWSPILARIEVTEKAMEKSERDRLNKAKLMNLNPNPIKLRENEVRADCLIPGNTLPLVISPLTGGNDLGTWVRNNLEYLESMFCLHGAVLFRGFDVASAAEFERIVETICPDLYSDNGEHDRSQISGRVYTPTFYPADRKVLWHNENSFNRRWPRRIWFYCVRPADSGGETPIVDSRKVFQLIPPEIREAFIRKKIQYVRNYGIGLGLSWQEVFRTSNRAEVEYACGMNGLEFIWKGNNKLMTRCVRPAVLKHPVTGEVSWFNQAQHWHLSCLDPETRETLTSSYADEDLPRNCLYGDSTPIEDEAITAICDVYRQLEVSYGWQANDLIMIDNISTAHARNPYSGDRKLLIAMGEMLSYDDMPVYPTETQNG